jgi:hypothetical protein
LAGSSHTLLGRTAMPIQKAMGIIVNSMHTQMLLGMHHTVHTKRTVGESFLWAQ